MERQCQEKKNERHVRAHNGRRVRAQKNREKNAGKRAGGEECGHGITERRMPEKAKWAKCPPIPFVSIGEDSGKS